MADESKIKTYFYVLLALAVATVIEVAIGSNAEAWGITPWTKLILLLAIAIFKASLIVAFFMHVKYEPRPLLLIILVFGVPLFVTLPVALFPIFFA